MQTELNPKLSEITVKNLRIRAYIGFMDWEKEKLQDLVISYSFSYNTNLATENDDVAEAVNYKKLTKKVIESIDQQSFSLIETVAEKIYNLVQNFSLAINDIDVKVEKPHALRFTDNVMAKISSTNRFNTAMIALGSNINPHENFERALDYLQKLGKIVERTAFISTKALKFEDQPDFLNGGILLLTKINLSSLHIELKQIEMLLRRVHSKNKNAPRQIDLDITTFNGFLLDKNIQELPFLIDFVKHLQPEIELELAT